MTDYYGIGDPDNEKEQAEFCAILDKWYLECKPQFKDSHPLGMRKEDLKGLVCDWLKTKTFDDAEVALVGDYNWIQVRDIIVKGLNQIVSYDGLTKFLHRVNVSFGTNLKQLKKHRKDLGLKPLSKEQEKELRDQGWK